jgi:NADPH:quinone reductase-like Zn-dependent oxidoreductase
MVVSFPWVASYWVSKEMVGNEIEPSDGSFAEYILMKADIAIHLPDHITFEEGAAISSGISTIALSMYSPKTLNFPIPTLPFERREGKEGFVFIYGGSSASGSLAIQFAKM